MLIFAIAFNLLLVLVNLYLVVRLWELRKLLAGFTKRLTRIERRLHRIFTPGPEFVLKGQQGTYRLRQRYQKLVFQLQQLRQIFLAMNLLLKLWQRRF